MIFLPLITAAAAGGLYWWATMDDATTTEDGATEAPDDMDGNRLRALAAEDKEVAYKLMFEHALIAVKKEGVPSEDAEDAAAMVTSHAALETGAFKHFVDRNFFGVNAVGDEPFIYAKDGGNVRKFKAYGSFTESFGAYVSLIHRRYPAAWDAMPTRDCAAYADGLKHRDDGAAYYEAEQGAFTIALRGHYAYLAGVL